MNGARIFALREHEIDQSEVGSWISRERWGMVILLACRNWRVPTSAVFYRNDAVAPRTSDSPKGSVILQTTAAS